MGSRRTKPLITISLSFDEAALAAFVERVLPLLPPSSEPASCPSSSDAPSDPPSPHYNPWTPAQQSELIDLLNKVGVADPKDVLARFEAKRIKAACQYVLTNPKVKEKAGWVMSCLAKGWAIQPRKPRSRKEK